MHIILLYKAEALIKICWKWRRPVRHLGQSVNNQSSIAVIVVPMGCWFISWARYTCKSRRDWCKKRPPDHRSVPQIATSSFPPQELDLLTCSSPSTTSLAPSLFDCVATNTQTIRIISANRDYTLIKTDGPCGRRFLICSRADLSHTALVRNERKKFVIREFWHDAQC